MRTRKKTTMTHIWCLVPGGPGEAVAGLLLPVVLGEPVIDSEDDDAVVALCCHPVGMPEVEVEAPLASIVDEAGQPWDVEEHLDSWACEAAA